MTSSPDYDAGYEQGRAEVLEEAANLAYDGLTAERIRALAKEPKP